MPTEEQDENNPDPTMYSEMRPGFYSLDPRKCLARALREGNERIAAFWQKRVDELVRKETDGQNGNQQ